MRISLGATGKLGTSSQPGFLERENGTWDFLVSPSVCVRLCKAFRIRGSSEWFFPVKVVPQSMNTSVKVHFIIDQDAQVSGSSSVKHDILYQCPPTWEQGVVGGDK